MIAVLVLMFVGMGIGHFLRNKQKLVKLNDKLTLYAIFLLLFLLGIVMGSNEQIMNNLGTLGLHSFFITIGALSGSIVLAYFVGKLFFRNKLGKN